MSLPLETIGLAEFALRVADAPGAGMWHVLVTERQSVFYTARELRDELKGFSLKVALLDQGTTPPDGELEDGELEDGELEDSVLLLTPEAARWRTLDAVRSRLSHAHAIVLVLSPESVHALFREAPHLTSWIGGRVWQLDPQEGQFTPEMVERRLEALRQHHGMTDEALLAQVAASGVPPSPEFVEWLILLGRSDLLGV